MSLSTNETTNATTSISSLCITTQTISDFEGFIGGLIVHLPYYFLFYSIIVQWKAFHPFFGLTFGAFLLSYIVIGILIQLVLLFKYLALSDGALFLFITDATDFMYYFILPINLICALERLFATIFYRKYEKMRPYTAVLIAWLLAIGFGTLLIANENNSNGFMSRFVQFAMYAGSMISALICIGVILTNIYMTKRLSGGKGKHPLTARYQLAENIKAVRIILPFIFIDNLITFLELSWTVLYQTSATYNADLCQKDPNTYIWLFLALIFIRHLMVVSIPPIIFFNSKTLRKPVIKLYYRWLSPTKGRIYSSDSIKRRKEFRNVIGEKVIFAQSQDLYFAQLAASW
ncbi:unnamed protein product, partial [Mesorhabditis belari]|uniref:Gustatory receptor n=1 Tax=Mesorhabditis belari TaxID=2138241 RepID=A0AAF3FRB9_9BILA